MVRDGRIRDGRYETGSSFWRTYRSVGGLYLFILWYPHGGTHLHCSDDRVQKGEKDRHSLWPLLIARICGLSDLWNEGDRASFLTCTPLLFFLFTSAS